MGSADLLACVLTAAVVVIVRGRRDKRSIHLFFLNIIIITQSVPILLIKRGENGEGSLAWWHVRNN